jgi:hypothetical protein
MNERIKELYGQAIQYADSVVPKHSRYNDIYYSIVSGKHAELIVRECASEAAYWTPNEDQGAEDREKHILQHFGVEE